MPSEFCLIVLVFVFQAIICSRQEKCAVLEFYPSEENVFLVPENQFVTVTFGMNISVCNNSNTTYKVIVQTLTNNGSLEYDGTIVYLTDTCVSIQPKAVRCITSTGPAELNRRVNRTHVGIRWEWQWKDAMFNNFTTMWKEIKMMVARPPQIIEFIDYGTRDHWKFRVKAHPTAVQKCVLTPSSLGGNKKKDVNCTLTGTPPNLLLTLYIDKEESSKSRQWALMLFTEKGSSDMFVFSTSSTDTMGLVVLAQMEWNMPGRGVTEASPPVEQGIPAFSISSKDVFSVLYTRCLRVDGDGCRVLVTDVVPCRVTNVPPNIVQHHSLFYNRHQ
ncbi:hypothetical protein C0Q70_12536 [Pomacea canaliculata]|uniref:Reelin domain-containing protein n=1 Tax=Pomacea canaliculata TaxID=400727 RepID=A0A2T7P1U3_POMCA|nr:hypothetical protein C0Q70_12536 [Pomacea canaliculata]